MTHRSEIFAAQNKHNEEHLRALLSDALAGDRLVYRMFLVELAGHLRHFLRKCMAIWHVKIHGDTVAETAARAGMTESAVKVGIHRGMKALAGRIREHR
jgi:hypothetical protein